MQVLIIGSGTMGRGITQVIAQAGIEVLLYDITEQLVMDATEKIAKDLEKLVIKEKITKEEKTLILSNITTCTDFNSAKNVELVIEAAIEKIEIKKQIFKQLDEILNSKAILATNTSSLSITEIATCTNRADKVIGVHFFNPAPVMKLVEVIKGLTTSEETFEFISKFILRINKELVNVNEAPGFIVNRILIPMINEAIGIYSDNVATKEDIDKAMMLGANHPIGPLALADLIGNDVVLAIMEVLYNEFSDNKYRPHPYLKKMVRAGMLGRKTKQGFYNYEKK